MVEDVNSADEEEWIRSGGYGAVASREAGFTRWLREVKSADEDLNPVRRVLVVGLM